MHYDMLKGMQELYNFQTISGDKVQHDHASLYVSESHPQTPLKRRRVRWHSANPLGFRGLLSGEIFHLPIENTICGCNTRNPWLLQHNFGTEKKLAIMQFSTASYEFLMKPEVSAECHLVGSWEETTWWVSWLITLPAILFCVPRSIKHGRHHLTLLN